MASKTDMENIPINKVCLGGMGMKGNPEERAVMLALYITENNATVRRAASAFGISKSTVHKDVTDRLYALNRSLYEQTQQVLKHNKEERHIRGGEATRKKYLERRQ